MRILHIIRTLNPAWGGPVTGLEEMSTAMGELGAQVEVLCMDDPRSEWLARWKVPIHPIGRGLFKYGYTPALKPWLAREASRFDSVVINGIWMYYSAATRDVLKGEGIPYYVFIHGALHPWLRHRYPLKHIKKSIYWKVFEHQVLRDAEATLFTTEEEKRLAENSFLPYRCTGVVAGYGINKHELCGPSGLQRQFRSLFPMLGEQPYILFLGRIHEVKALDVLFGAVATIKNRLGDRKLVVAGGGDKTLVNRLKALSASLEIDRHIVWTGPLDGKMKWGALCGAEALVLPSHLENFGISAAESLSCGVPVLISDKVNIWREVRDQGAGLTGVDNIEGVASMLIEWFDLSENQRSRMRENASRCLDAHFNMGTNARSLLKILTAHARCTSSTAATNFAPVGTTSVSRVSDIE